MKFFADTRTKRNTAFAMLLVWLFAVTSGVANACFLETHEPHSTIKVSAAETGHSHSRAEPSDHPGATVYHDEDPGSTNEACLKACDDGTHTLLKAHAGVDHADPGLATLVATLWTGLPLVDSALRRLDDLETPLFGPPFRVRYSRLLL